MTRGAGVVCALLAACGTPRAPDVATVALTPDEVAEAGPLADAELERWLRERDERFQEAVDRGEQAEHVRRVRHEHIAAGKAAVADVFLQGEAIFERMFTLAEGMGTGMLARPRPALSRIQNPAAVGGPDAIACRDCHGRGGDDGHGELHQRAWLDGDGRSLGSAFPRVPPHLAGVGVLQALAAEMTAELREQVEQFRAARRDGAANARLALIAKGVGFGTLVVGADGALDTEEVRGVDPDLIVKPFGWKGTQRNLRDFARRALPQHIGLDPLPAVGDPVVGAVLKGRPASTTAIELRGGLFDADRDGVGGELAEGQLTSLAVYLALLDVPVVQPPRTPVAYAAWRKGARLFASAGCAECHRPELALASTHLEEGPPDGPALTLDLIDDNQVPPRLERFDRSEQTIAVALFSDLRRHDLGPALAERVDGGAGPSEFLTRPLWGLGDRGPYYLHDGRARSLSEAITLHGGEAAAARDAYAALAAGDARALEVFLLSLVRQPQGRYIP